MNAPTTSEKRQAMAEESRSGTVGRDDHQDRWPVVVAGAGPVGTSLALELGRRGVPTLVLEADVDTTSNPRCNTTNARSMEYFRRMGIADRIRRAGLPLDQATDVVYCTAILGEELTRFEFSTSEQILAGDAPEFADWPTPEPQHRISQIYLEPILHEELARLPSVELRRGSRVLGATQDDDGVVVRYLADGGEEREVRASYVVGCDGGASAVRRAIGAVMEGDGKAAEERLSVYFRSSELGAALAGRRPGWMYWWYGERLRGSFLQLNGDDLFLCHARVPEGMTPEELDEDEALVAAVGRPVEHEKIQVIRWTPRRLVADRFRSDRILLAGDAAHLWLPLGGFGMNTGIADAIGLGWRLAAVLDGWAGPRVLDDYEAERRSVGEATSIAALKIDRDMKQIGRDPEFHADSDRGRRLRTEAGGLIEAKDRQQWYSQGVQFGSRYVDSPGVAGPAGAGPRGAVEDITTYVPSVDPGTRFPHVWLADGTSVFDRLGPELTLVVVDAPELSHQAGALLDGARRLGVPVEQLDLSGAQLRDVYDRRLVLVRPDLFVAWSGDEPPADPAALFEALLGRAPTPTPPTSASRPDHPEETMTPTTAITDNPSIWVALMGQPLTIRQVQVGDWSTRVLEAGSGPETLILMHGVGGHLEAYARNIPAFAERYRVIAYDFPGHGFTTHATADLELSDYVDHLSGLMDVLGVERAHLNGESLGGWVAMKCAVAHPERVDKLVLNTPGGNLSVPEVRNRLRTLSQGAADDPSDERIRTRLEWLMADNATVTQELVDTRRTIYSRPGFSDSMRFIMCLQDQEIRARNMVTDDDLDAIDSTTLVVWTSDDPSGPAETGLRIAERLVNGRFELVRNAGHWPQWEQHADFNRIVVDFLAEA
jgi:2-polyprenyl-6-methoxyphenol hydroxylase-like FAD-dependent oxidoreductase/pimeloyl-ACP methyl ester carboxylesterase